MWRFFQQLRAHRQSQDMIRWIGRLQVQKKRLEDAWMDLLTPATDTDATFLADLAASPISWCHAPFIDLVYIGCSRAESFRWQVPVAFAAATADSSFSYVLFSYFINGCLSQVFCLGFFVDTGGFTRAMVLGIFVI